MFHDYGTMTNRTETNMGTIRLGNAYDAREEIKNVGGTFDAATKSWLVTEEQLAKLVEHAETSARRFNRRDTEFSRVWARVTQTVQS